MSLLDEFLFHTLDKMGEVRILPANELATIEYIYEPARYAMIEVQTNKSGTVLRAEINSYGDVNVNMKEPAHGAVTISALLTTLEVLMPPAIDVEDVDFTLIPDMAEFRAEGNEVNIVYREVLGVLKVDRSVEFDFRGKRIIFNYEYEKDGDREHLLVMLDTRLISPPTNEPPVLSVLAVALHRLVDTARKLALLKKLNEGAYHDFLRLETCVEPDDCREPNVYMTIYYAYRSVDDFLAREIENLVKKSKGSEEGKQA